MARPGRSALRRTACLRATSASATSAQAARADRRQLGKRAGSAAPRRPSTGLEHLGSSSTAAFRLGQQRRQAARNDDRRRVGVDRLGCVAGAAGWRCAPRRPSARSGVRAGRGASVGSNPRGNGRCRRAGPPGAHTGGLVCDRVLEEIRLVRLAVDVHEVERLERQQVGADVGLRPEIRVGTRNHRRPEDPAGDTRDLERPPRGLAQRVDAAEHQAVEASGQLERAERGRRKVDLELVDVVRSSSA